MWWFAALLFLLGCSVLDVIVKIHRRPRNTAASIHTAFTEGVSPTH